MRDAMLPKPFLLPAITSISYTEGVTNINIVFPERKESPNHTFNDATVISGGLNQAIELCLKVIRIPVASSSKTVNSTMQELENVWKEHANGFKCKEVGKRNLSFEGYYSAVDGSGVSSNISHVLDKWPDDLLEYIWPDFFIKRARVFDVVKNIV